jgi:transposase IS481 family protein
MPQEAASAPPLPLVVSESFAAQDVLARYEAIRPVLTGERPLVQQSQQIGVNYWRLWRDLRRFRRAGLLGLVDRRTLPHARGKPTVDALLHRYIQQHIVRLAIAHSFTARELARVVRDCYHYPVDYRGIQRVPEQHHLSPTHCSAIACGPSKLPLPRGLLGNNSACPSSPPPMRGAWNMP